MNILNIFKHKKKDTPSENSISFILDKEDNVKIKLLFELNSFLDADRMSQFLYELNSGLLSQSIIDLMLDLGKENSNYQPFIKNTIMLWLQKITENTNSINIDNQNAPIVKPSNFTTHSSTN
jgi:hypothetical protein